MEYLISPSRYTVPNPRIDGFRKLKEVGARTVDISVFSLKAFEFYQEHHDLPDKFVEELELKSNEIIKASLTHAAVVRRAFVVPGIDNPPGPRFLGLTTSQAVVDAVRELYKFAIEQNYQKDKKSQISGFLYPFIDPEKYNKQKPNISAIPYGGYAIFESDRVEIYAVFGNNEGVQSLIADRYEVEIKGKNRFLILKKEIPQKDKMFCTTEDSTNELVQVPLELQLEQVLVDNEILEISRVLFELSERYGPQRVEFTADASGILFNEVSDYWKEEKKEGNSGNIKVVGKITTINGVGDLEKLNQFSKEELLSEKLSLRLIKKLLPTETTTSWEN